MSNFNYCPKVWHLCSKVNATKLEKIENKEALRCVFNDNISFHEFLIEQSKSTTLHFKRLKLSHWKFLNP